MARPKADLDSLAVPKAEGETSAATPAPTSPQKGYSHTLSLRLTAEQYRRLRRYVVDQEEKTGKRATHQAVIEAALEAYLSARSA